MPRQDLRASVPAVMSALGWQLSTAHPRELTQLEGAASPKATSPSRGSSYVVTGLEVCPWWAIYASELPAGLAEALLRLHCSPAVPLPPFCFLPLCFFRGCSEEPLSVIFLRADVYVRVCFLRNPSWNNGMLMYFLFGGAHNRAIEIDVQVTVTYYISAVLRLKWKPLLWEPWVRRDRKCFRSYPSFSSKVVSRGSALNRSKDAGSLSLGMVRMWKDVQGLFILIPLS